MQEGGVSKILLPKINAGMYLQRYDNPELTGVILKERVRCGKSNCRCARGKLHGWYYYHYYREFDGEGWRLRKRYVPRSRVKYLRRKIRGVKERENQVKRQMRLNAALLRLARLGAPTEVWNQLAYEITR